MTEMGVKLVLSLYMKNTEGTWEQGKGKVVPVLFVTEHHAMEAYWGVVV
jgi:hypothetical protein